MEGARHERTVGEEKRLKYLEATMNFKLLVHRRGFGGVLTETFLPADGVYDPEYDEREKTAMMDELQAAYEATGASASGGTFESSLAAALRASAEHDPAQHDGMSYEQYVRAQSEPEIDRLYAI